MKLVRRLSTLGYGSRKDAMRLLRAGRVRDASGRRCTPQDVDDGGAYTVDGDPLDPRPTIVVVLHKPCGVETTRAGTGATVYDCLPPRFRERSPILAPVGRLDKDTSGLLLFTDDGVLLHRLTHPKHHVAKTYAVTTARPILPGVAPMFAAGTLLLRGETEPLAPAELDVTGPKTATVTVREGRYHQVRRMWAAVGNHIEQLHRVRVGPLELGDLEVGTWRWLTTSEVARLRRAVGFPTAAERPPGQITQEPRDPQAAPT